MENVLFMNSTASQFSYKAWQGRYYTKLITSEEETRECLEVLEEVRRKELNRVAGKSVFNSHSFEGKKQDFRLVGCRDQETGKMIGCMRITEVNSVKHIESSRKEYKLDLFTDAQLDKLLIFTRLAVLKDYRLTPAAMLLMSYAFVYELMENRKKGFLMTCEPKLYAMYQKLGLRSIGHMHNSPSGGYRIPMLCIPDKAYFEEIRNPAMRYIKDLPFEDFRPSVEDFLTIIEKQSNLEIGVSIFEEDPNGMDGHLLITDGLQTESVARLFRNALVLNSKKGDIIVEKGDGGKSIGIVKQGSVFVELPNGNQVVLPKGRIFGEISSITGGRRTARIVAADDHTEVVLLNVDNIAKIRNTDDKVRLWQNISRIVAMKLIHSNNAKAGKDINN